MILCFKSGFWIWSDLAYEFLTGAHSFNVNEVEEIQSIKIYVKRVFVPKFSLSLVNEPHIIFKNHVLPN